MTQRRGRTGLVGSTLLSFACLIAEPAVAQTNGGDLPTAEEVWRHLPGSAVESPPSSETAVVEPAAPDTSIATQRPPNRTTAPLTRLADTRAVIHYQESRGSRRPDELARDLRALGMAEVEIRPVRLAIDRQSIRYFHAADRAASGIIAREIGGRGQPDVSDFTFYRPLPRRGTVEIWLP